MKTKLPKFSKVGSEAITRHEQHTFYSYVTLVDGRKVKIPIDSSDARLDWYWIQVTHGVEKFLSENPL